MNAAHFNIRGCRQGSTFVREFVIHTLNLTGYKARMVAKYPHSDQSLFEASTEGDAPWLTLVTDSETTGTPPNEVTVWTNTLTLSITDETTATFWPKMYDYDIEIEAPNGSTDPLLEGKFVVDPQHAEEPA